MSGGEDVPDVLLGHGREKWEGDRSVVVVFRVRIIAFLVSEPVPVIRVQGDRDVMDLYTNILGTEGVKDRFSIRAAPVQVELYGIDVVSVFDVVCFGREDDAVQVV